MSASIVSRYVKKLNSFKNQTNLAQNRIMHDGMARVALKLKYVNGLLLNWKKKNYGIAFTLLHANYYSAGKFSLTYAFPCKCYA